jgi:hypothetical protein
MSDQLTPTMNGRMITGIQNPVLPGTGVVPAQPNPPSPRRPEISNESNGQPLGLAEILAHVASLTNGWPRVVANRPCVPVWDHTAGRWRIDYPAKAAELFAWLDRYGQVRWSKRPGTYDKTEFYEAVRQLAHRAEWASETFHTPMLADVVYVNPMPEPRRTGALDRLLEVFAPATPEDRVLIEAFILTLFWGGPVGKRPLFVFSTAGAGADPAAGRGSGKSTVAHVGGRLCGGHLSVGGKRDGDRLVSDLLSPHGLGVRLVLMDNVKSLKFSSAEIEALITAPVIDGHVLYAGHGSRPNYVTYALTANEPVLSTDLASRAIPIEVAPTRKSAAWDEQLEGLLGNPAWRDALFSDVAWHLVQPPAGYTDDADDRWPLWWKHVGYAACRTPDVLDRVRRAVRERRTAVDGDRAARDALTDALTDALSEAGVEDPAGSVVFVPVPVLTPLVQDVIGREVAASEVGKWVRAASLEHLFREKNGPVPPNQRSAARGYWWVGPTCPSGGYVPVYAVWHMDPNRPRAQLLTGCIGRQIVQRLRPGPAPPPGCRVPGAG